MKVIIKAEPFLFGVIMDTTKNRSFLNCTLNLDVVEINFPKKVDSFRDIFQFQLRGLLATKIDFKFNDYFKEDFYEIGNELLKENNEKKFTNDKKDETTSNEQHNLYYFEKKRNLFMNKSTLSFQRL